MPLAEYVLIAITEKVFNYALDQGQNKVVDWVCDKLGLEPMKQAFKRALNKAYKKFEKQYPQWSADLFNASFLETEGAPILAQFLIRDGNPDPSNLAICWADSLNIDKLERHTTLVRELEPAASDFLDNFVRALKAEPELSDLNDSRAFEQLVADLKALRKRFEAEQWTPGTRRDYLHWLIERNLYLDPRGTFQTQRQVQVKLVEIYISLRAQLNRTIRLMPQGLNSKLVNEEIENQNIDMQILSEIRSTESDNIYGEIIELAEAVKSHDRLVILGDPGSGKSTLLRYLALKYAQALWHGRTDAGSDLGTACFPILIRIADYAEYGIPKGKSLSDFLADYYSMLECPKSGLADLLASELAEGNCLILLDGLDEIVSADNRRNVVKRIEDFERSHIARSNRLVITSRIAGYSGAPLGEPFIQYTVQEMDEKQIRHFLERWCIAVEAVQTPELSVEAREAVASREINGIMKAVQTAPGVRRLAANPLLLRTLALIHRTGAQLPQKRIELYKLAADTLTGTWRTAQGVPESALVKERYLTRLLSRLAYWLHSEKATGIATEQEVYTELGQEWARIKGLSWEENNPDIDIEVQEFLRAVQEHTGLFVERAPKRYGFMHLTFEEYYAARYLVARSKERARLIRQHLHKPRWEEPILLALGFVGLDSPEDAAELLETAIMAEGKEARDLGFGPSRYEDLVGRDFLFALRCLGDNIPAQPEVIEKLIKRLANELLYRTGSAQFLRYKQALREKLKSLQECEGNTTLFSILIEKLSDSNPNIRRRTGDAFGQLGQASPEVVTALIRLLRDTDPGVRNAGAWSLGQLGQASPEVVTALIETLYDANPLTHIIVAESLAQLGQTSISVILDHVKDLRDIVIYVRNATELQSGQWEQASSEVLIAFINAVHDVDPLIRNRAIRNLGQLGQSPQEVVTALIAALHESDPDARNRAARSLGQLGQASSEVVTALINALHDSKPFVRSGVAWSLGQLGQSSPEIVTTLIQTLKDANPGMNIRSGVAWSLGQLGQSSPEIVTTLIQTLKDANPVVRAGVIWGLGQLGQREPSYEIIETLINGLNDKAPQVRISAAESLGQLGQKQISHKVLASLFNALNDKFSGVRRTAAESLCRLGQSPPEAINVLIETLSKAKDYSVRSNSAHLLGQIGQSDESTLQALWFGLLDSHRKVRNACAQALAELGQRFPKDVQIIEKKLLQAIKDPEFDELDSIKRSGHDYAYDALWLLVVGGEAER